MTHICNSSATAGSAYTLGAPTRVDPEDSVHAKLILVWGCNIVSTNLYQVMLANEVPRMPSPALGWWDDPQTGLSSVNHLTG